MAVNGREEDKPDHSLGGELEGLFSAVITTFRFSSGGAA
jgi:hypothetical protein